MSEFTAEEVRDEVSMQSSLPDGEVAARMLRAYADSIERAQAGVTTEVVDRACLAYDDTTTEVADYPSEAGMRAALTAVWPNVAVQPEPASADVEDAARYRWLRDPRNEVGKIIDKAVGAEAAHEGVQAGGYHIYEYRSSNDLDAAIDAARAAKDGE